MFGSATLVASVGESVTTLPAGGDPYFELVVAFYGAPYAVHYRRSQVPIPNEEPRNTREWTGTESAINCSHATRVRIRAQELGLRAISV